MKTTCITQGNIAELTLELMGLKMNGVNRISLDCENWVLTVDEEKFEVGDKVLYGKSGISLAA